MADLFKTIIYYNQKKRTSDYVVAFLVGEVVHIEQINEFHQECSEVEKAIIRDFVSKHLDLFPKADMIEVWIEATNRNQNMSLYTLKNAIDIINNSSTGEESVSYDYFIYNFKNNEYKKVRNENKIAEIKEEISYHVLTDIAHFDRKISFYVVRQEIGNYLANNAPRYATMECKFCNKYTVFKYNTGSTGICSSCGNVSQIVDPTYDGVDIYLATTNANTNNANKMNSQVEVTNSKAIFYYNGQPFLSFPDTRKELHERIYNRRDGRAIFEIVDKKVVFKKEYIKYVESYNSNFSNIIYDLENVQYDENVYFNEDVALYWYYHHFNVVDKVDNAIFINGESFKTVKDFIKRFVSSSEEKQRFYFSLINDVYLEYFFNKDEEIISSYNKAKDLSKLIYKTTGDYVYIDTSSGAIHNFKQGFFYDLILDDKDNALRFEFLTEIDGDFESFGLESLTDRYFSKLEDHYDYNCFIYSVMRNDGYYYFKDLRIPVDERCINYIDDIIERKYLNTYHNHQADKLFSQLYTLWNKELLDFTLVAQIDTSLKAAFKGLKDDLSNLLEIYLRRKQNVSPNEVEFVYNGIVDTLLGHAQNAFKRGQLVDFTKDREIENITNLLFKDNKKTIFDNAVKSFTDMNKEIDKIIKETRESEN